MNRIATSARPNCQARVEEVGLSFHTPEGTPYWDETAYYQLNAREVDALEAAGNELHLRYIEAAQHVIDHDLFGLLGIPKRAIPFIRRSWDRDDFSLYGRFDLAYDGCAPPKLLEYNADTPTALIEAAVAQWFWLQDTHRLSDQFNSIHEKLIDAWREFDQSETIYFGGVTDHAEDTQTVLYIQDTCHQAGHSSQQLFIEDLGFDRTQQLFVD